jgi:hypothetical protein
MTQQQQFLTWIGLTTIGWGMAVTGLAAMEVGVPAPQVASSFELAALKQTLKQKLSLSGALYRYEPANPKASPPPLPGYRAYLYSRPSNRWIGPSITDSYGRYAFYDVAAGTYLLRIYPAGYRGELTQNPSKPAVQPYSWQQEVKVPGQVRPIVLRNPTALMR